ncbi:hydroxymethylglutaryl-CoA lyase [Niabella insulamsoli]|uniref:hydroxymethylglutaryl-CoA lyase n=1 Tax=Niabella insulamsoli TaxID=3144874 RepID=UPI0031FD1B38
MHNKIKITESPRDAQQGLPFTIEVEQRAAYINELMKAGFDVIDFGSFVSPKAVPQMADSGQVLQLVDKSLSATKLLAIVGNTRGALEASALEKVDLIGFPYSISNTFLQKNINSDLTRVYGTAQEIAGICIKNQKVFRVFISMAFGNPYGDEWNENILKVCVQSLVDIGVQAITLSDTVGLATPLSIKSAFDALLPVYPNIELGLHLHTEPQTAGAKIDAAWNAGCRSFDGVLNGIGGCPMTGYELLGNLNTLDLLSYCKEMNIPHQLNEPLLQDIASRYIDFQKIKYK